jgi:hypothetical protein
MLILCVVSVQKISNIKKTIIRVCNVIKPVINVHNLFLQMVYIAQNVKMKKVSIIYSKK